MHNEEKQNVPAAAEAAHSGSAEPAQGNSANTNDVNEIRKELAEVHSLLAQYQERLAAPTPSYTTGQIRQQEYARDQRPLLTREQAINTVGPAKWKSMTVEQRVLAQGFTAQDVAEHKLEKYFGPNSNSGAANKLAISNPALYKVLKAKAREEGLI